MMNPKAKRAICILCGTKTYISEGRIWAHFQTGNPITVNQRRRQQDAIAMEVAAGNYQTPSCPMKETPNTQEEMVDAIYRQTILHGNWAPPPYRG